MRTLAGWSVILLPLVLAVAGYLAGPSLARMNYTVELAHELTVGGAGAARAAGATVSSVVIGGEREDRALAFEAAGGVAAALRQRAAAVVSRFRLGAAALGAWCGLVVGVGLLTSSRRPRRREYEVDHGQCVACGRCFTSCPKEHERLKTLGKGRRGLLVAESNQ